MEQFQYGVTAWRTQGVQGVLRLLPALCSKKLVVLRECLARSSRCGETSTTARRRAHALSGSAGIKKSQSERCIKGEKGCAQCAVGSDLCAQQEAAW